VFLAECEGCNNAEPNNSVRAFPVEHAPEITPIALERDSETHTLSTAWGIRVLAEQR